jgi:hypothetical protein
MSGMTTPDQEPRCTNIQSRNLDRQEMRGWPADFRMNDGVRKPQKADSGPREPSRGSELWTPPTS